MAKTDETLNFHAWACEDPECGMVHISFWVGKKPPEFSCSFYPEDIASIAGRMTSAADKILVAKAKSTGKIN